MSLRVYLLSILSCVVLASAAEATSVRGLDTGEEHVCVLTSAGEVQCWGGNGYGQLGDGTTTGRTTPGDVLGLPSGIVSLGVGLYHACAVTRDGGVQCWGRNDYGQLGDGTTTNRSTPVEVSGLGSGVIAVAAGRYHTCALSAAGGVGCWGRNIYGQIGDNTTTTRLTPVIVSGLTPAASVTAGGYHTCAVTTAGGVKCWGFNGDGEVGDGSTTDRWTPTTVSTLTSGAVVVAAGKYSNCAVKTDGGVVCWGDNVSGQLGDGSTSDRLTPVAVSGLTAGVAAVEVGDYHACAVLGTGALKCWGRNTSGQVGDGATTDRWTPVSVSGLASGVAAAAAGQTHTCALLSDGGVRCWGNNESGRLGDGTTTAHVTPAAVSGLTGGGTLSAPGATRVAVGRYHACAVTGAGGVQCWGNNTYGKLGDGTMTLRITPVAVRGLASGVASVTVGAEHSCALTTSGGVTCWGNNPGGQLGDGTTTSRSTPVSVSGLASGVVMVSAGGSHTCAVTTAGGLKCWGLNDYGQLGDGTGTNRSTPVTVSGLESGVSAVSAGWYHTCALSTTGGLRCWGYNAFGQLGDGTTTARATPVWVSGMSSSVAAVAAGGVHTCAITTGGGVRCWGHNASGQVGDGTTTTLRATPVAVSGLASDVVSVSSGGGHTCAVTIGGRAHCWGDNEYGGLGDGTTTNRSTPVVVSGLTTGATSVWSGTATSCAVTSRGGVQCWGQNDSGVLGDGTIIGRWTPGWVMGFVGSAGAIGAGTSHSCRVTAAGGVQCWGSNSYGQVGDGTNSDRRTPVDAVGLTSGVVAVSAGSDHACALTSAGAVKCWGVNPYGQLGDGTTTNRSTPVNVVGLTAGATAVETGSYHTCALTSAGGVLCWGGNSSGQLGDGTTVDRTTPAYVRGLTSGVIGLAAGGYHACALTAAGGVLCWGDNYSGQLGNGTTANSPMPTWVSSLRSGVRALTAGVYHTCALTTAGAPMCWGENIHDQLGDPTTWRSTTPTAVSGLTSRVVGLAAASYGTCALVSGVGVRCWGTNHLGQLGDGTTTNRSTPVAVSGLSSEAAAIAAGSGHACAATAAGGITCWGGGSDGELGNGTTADRLTPTAVRGFKLDDAYDSDLKADVAVYRPSTGTWFSLDSTTGNASFQYRGWGVQAQGDVPVPGCDFDGDGVVDPTVFRPSAGTWFSLESVAGFTTWDHFGWGTTGDTPVPADYDGDGLTDAAVYRPSEGKWYVRPSGGGTQWNVTFGNSTDVPIPGYYDADGKADLAVYRPATGTWFILTSSSGYASYWYKGWGVQASGDTPAPGDYDGDGRMDLCVFRPSTGTWFILESHANFTTWDYYGWGGSGDTVVPSDYDGDGITDAAVYRPSTYTWYIRPSSGATQWSIVFGTSGDVQLITIR